MKLIDILKSDAFEGSKILAGQKSLNNTVSSIMILEASDIENWGVKNQIILSSYFALVDLDRDGLEEFFNKMKSIGISGLIIKPQRLLKQIPQHLIELSNQTSIPLILIQPQVKYENIVMSVLQPIINKNAEVLNAYYDYRQMLNTMSFNNLSLQEVLLQFKSYLHTDTQIELLGQDYIVTTLPKIEPVYEESTRIIEQSKYVAHQYMERKLSYRNKTNQSILSVLIPNIDNKPYLFSIFKKPDTISEKETMLIENAVEYLKTYFLIEHSNKKDQFVLKNNQMLDLIFTPNLPIANINSILSHLNINKFNHYQGVLFGVKSPACHDKQIMEQLVAEAKKIWPHVAFLLKNEEIIFLYNISSDHVLSDNDFKHLMQQDCVLHIAISEPFELDFHKSMQTLELMRQFMNTIYSTSHIMDYQKLGFYKLFLNVESLEELIEYVPNQIIQLIKEKPDLAETLETFLDQNQNYVKTSEILYIHPKTVRYRIERIIEHLNLDLEDANQLLTTHIALKVVSYAKLKN